MSADPLLEGIRILDLSQLIAGPSATAMLAEMGAQVIKLESPDGDISRKMGRVRKHGASATFAAYNLATRDVVVEAIRPGVVDELGLGFEVASTLNPSLVYVSFSGFGSDGPLAKWPGVDIVIQGESGIMFVIGEAGHESASRRSTPPPVSRPQNLSWQAWCDAFEPAREAI